MFVTKKRYKKLEAHVDRLLGFMGSYQPKILENEKYIDQLKIQDIEKRLLKLPKGLLKKLVRVESGYDYNGEYYINPNGQISLYSTMKHTPSRKDTWGDNYWGSSAEVTNLITALNIDIDKLELRIERMKKLKCK